MQCSHLFFFVVVLMCYGGAKWAKSNFLEVREIFFIHGWKTTTNHSELFLDKIQTVVFTDLVPRKMYERFEPLFFQARRIYITLNPPSYHKLPAWNARIQERTRRMSTVKTHMSYKSSSVVVFFCLVSWKRLVDPMARGLIMRKP